MGEILKSTQRVLIEERRPLPSKKIAELARERGYWDGGRAETRQEQDRSFTTTLAKAITAPYARWEGVFYRERSLYGLTAWQDELSELEQHLPYCILLLENYRHAQQQLLDEFQDRSQRNLAALERELERWRDELETIVSQD